MKHWYSANIDNLSRRAIQRWRFLTRKKVNQQFILIESDDWGLERAQREDAILFTKRKYGVENVSRWTTDSLETKSDLEILFDLLYRYKNKFEFPPIITANFITHNIDYSSQNTLQFLPINKGFNKETEDVRAYYIKGIQEKFITAQLHGYCHYNLSALRQYFFTDNAKDDFNNGFALAKTTIKKNLNFLEGEFINTNAEGRISFATALEVFKGLFNVESNSFIPPRYMLDASYLSFFKTHGIEMIQAGNHLVNHLNKKYYPPILHRKKGLVFSIRNARLDPHPDYNFDSFRCFQQIEKAFASNMPAIIDFHRVNFAGRFAKEYAQTTIKELDTLFTLIHKKYPAAHFLDTPTFNHFLYGD